MKIALSISAMTALIVAVGMVPEECASAEPNSQVDALEEVVVTAQKREEDLQRVPISITAVTADQFEKAGLQNTWDVAELTPGVQVGRTGPINQGFSMRGVLSGDGGAGSDRSVVVFLDDLYIGRSSGFLFDIADIERVEVLKGPQGTLSGRNVAGGSINIVTRRPQRELGGSLEATVGNYQLAEVKARITGALSERTAGSLSYFTSQRDGYNRLGPGVVSPNALAGKDIDAPASTTVRGKLGIEPSDSVSVLLTGGYSRFRQDGISKKVYPAGTYTQTQFGFTPNPDPRLVEGYLPGFANSELYMGSARIDFHTGVGTWTSITGLLHTHAVSGQDSIFIPEGLWRSYFSNNERTRTLTEELRLASPDSDGPLSWVAGLYLLREDVERIDSYDRDFLGATSYPIYNQHNTTTSIAAFGNVVYAMTEKMRVSVGVRYTKDRKHMDNSLEDGLNGTSTNGLVPAIALYDVSVSDSWDAFTPKVTLDYSPTEKFYLYATYAAGFKAGGFQGVAPEVVAASTPFLPEKVRSFEIGAKTRWFSDRLQVNTAAFSMDYTDMQLGLRILTRPGDESSALRLLTNASDARIRGVEFETLARPIRGLTLALNYTYLDTELQNYNPGFGGVDLSGNELPSPNHALTASLDYQMSVGQGSSLGFYVDYRYNGERFLSLANTPAGASPLAATEPSYDVMTARVTYRTPSDWKFSLWGKNLGDTLYRVDTIIVGNSGFSDFGAPRTYGVSLGREF